MEGITHTLVVNYVQDLAGNSIDPNTQASFTYDSAATPTVHVEDVTVQLKTGGRNRLYATSQVTILDGDASPVANATILGRVDRADKRKLKWANRRKRNRYL